MAALRRAVAPISFALLAALIAPREAGAWVCTKVKDSSPPVSLVWQSRCIPYAISRAGTILTGTERRQLIAQSFSVWSSSACTDLSFLDVGYTDETGHFDEDHPEDQLNVVASVEDETMIELFPDPRLIAITLTRFSKATGELFDADILINGIRFRFDDVADPIACQIETRRPFDLRNTLVHEIGHFVGFDHDPESESTMYFNAVECETKKRDLTADDRVGLCGVYPKDQAAKTCFPPSSYTLEDAPDPEPYRNQCDRFTGNASSCSCTLAERATSPWTAAALLFGLWVWRKRRRA